MQPAAEIKIEKCFFAAIGYQKKRQKKYKG